MTIVEKVRADLLLAMKKRDSARLSALRMVQAELQKASKTPRFQGRPLDDATAVYVLRSLHKQRLEAAAAYDSAGRPELAEKERAEARVIESYLPPVADEAQTLLWVREAIAATGARGPREIGRVMGHIMNTHRGMIDPALARRLADRELAGLAR